MMIVEKDKLESQYKIIELIKDLAAKANFPSDISAVINSINDTLPDEDSIDCLESVVARYDKETALYQIIFLMDAYKINLYEIQNHYDAYPYR
jgi:hypothetical protein